MLPSIKGQPPSSTNDWPQKSYQSELEFTQNAYQESFQPQRRSGWGHFNANGDRKVQPSGAIPQEHHDETHIKKLKNSNSLDKTQFGTSEDYINKLRFSIELDSLYKVYDSCCSNQAAQFCPVLVEVGKEFRNWGKFDFLYLLQVWSRAGKLIFERQLMQPLANWNLHDDYFVFQEACKEDQAPRIFMIQLNENGHSQLYPLTMPLVADEIDPLNDPKSKGISGALGESLKRKMGLAGIFQSTDKKKIKKQIGIAKNHLIISKGTKVFYTHIDEIKSKTPRTISNGMNFFEIADECKLIDIMDIGNKETVLILSNQNKHLVFYQIKSFNQSDSMNNHVNVQLVKLGLNDHDIHQKHSLSETLAQPVQVRAVVMLDDKKVYNEKDGQQQKFTCSAVVLRADRSFEFYSDFNMVSSSRQMHQDEKQLQCINISVSNDGYLLLVNQVDEEEIVTLYEVSFSWGNLLGMSVATKMRKADLKVKTETMMRERRDRNDDRVLSKEDIIIKAKKEIQRSFSRQLEAASHQRISLYFRIFTQFFNYTTFMLVAHREYISVFDLKSNGQVNIHFTYPDQVIMLADSKKLIISVLLGNNEIHQITQNVTDDGIKISSSPEAVNQIPDRVVNFCTDQNNDTAVYFLVQKGVGRNDNTFDESDPLTRVRYSEPSYNQTNDFQLYALFGQEYIQIAADRELVLDEKTQIKVFYKHEGKELQSRLMVQGPDVTYTIPIVIKENNLIALKESEYSSVFKGPDAEDSLPNPAITELYEKLGKKSYLSGRLVGAVTGEGESYGNREGFMAKITTEGIEVYDQTRKLVEYYTNPAMQELVLVDETYVYCLCEASSEPMKKYDFKKQVVNRPRGASISKQQKGLYVYDIERLLKDGQVENYYLAPAAVGMAHQLDFSDSSGRLSYFTNFREISMLPFPHRNTINFLGMGDKKDYVIWRESDGFFTALHNSGQLRIWSIGSGKFIGIKSLTDLPEKGQSRKLGVHVLSKEYEIYEAHDQDTCYTKNFQNFKNHTIQLLKKRVPELNEDDSEKIDNNNFKSQIGHSVKTIIAEQDTYEFLVVKMTTNTDKKKKKKGLFNLNKKYVDIGTDANLKAKIVMRFTLPLPKGEKRPTLHLSKDLKKMMEVVDRQVAVIYKRDKYHTLGSKVVWLKKHLISQYPTLLQGTSTLPFLFDPNFNRYIDVDYAKGHFVIRSVDRRKKDRDWPDEVVIPKSLLSLSITVESTQFQSKKELVIQNEESISAIAKRMHFVKKNMIRIVNSEGIDTLYDLKTSKIVVYSKRDNLNVMRVPAKSQKHFFLEREDFEEHDSLARLVHMTQNYKCQLEFAKYDLTCRLAAGKRYKKPKLLSYLYKVEFRSDKFVAEASFTLLDWIICERIQNDSLFDLNDIDRQQQIQLCFNIFPKAKTVLHMLALNSETSQDKASEQSESIGNIAQKLFSVCKKGLQSDYNNFKKKIPFELPIVEDMMGHTVLDIALERHDIFKDMSIGNRFWDLLDLVNTKEPTIFRDSNRHFVSRFKNYASELVLKNSYEMPSLNSQLAMTIFANIQSYGYLHSSQIIYPAVIEAIKVGLPNIGEYLDNRLVESQHMPNGTQHDLQDSSRQYCHTGAQQYDKNEPGSEDKWLSQTYNTVLAQLWEQKTKLEGSLFKKDGVHKNMIIRYLDVPMLDTNQVEGIAFIRAMRNLSRSTPEEIQMNIYGKRSIQIVINEHWKRTYIYIIAFLFVPYVAMLVIYSIWSNFSLQGTSEWAVEAGGSFQTVLVVMSIYFLCFELIQFVTYPIMYLLEGWSYIKTLPMVLVLINATWADVDRTSLEFWQRQAVCGFCMWLRLLYFMRSIEQFSYFIIMLMQVVWKIKIFLIILMIAVFGFADTFYSLSTSTIYMDPYTNADGDSVMRPSYITGYINSLQYSYEIVIGQFGDDLNDQDSLSWFFFILASIISMLVLANLLIEIVAETYGEVTSKKYLFVFKERVELICDWQSDMVVVQVVKNVFMFTLKPIFWCLSKMGFRKKHTDQIASAYQQVQRRCELLMVAWEDPASKGQTIDVVEDENEETTDEKIDLVKMTLNDMKVQLGLQSEIQDDFDTAIVQNPIQSIQLINDKMEAVIERLGLNIGGDEQFYPEGMQSESEYGQSNNQRFNQQPSLRSVAGVKYKKDEIFGWQAKRNNN